MNECEAWGALVRGRELLTELARAVDVLAPCEFARGDNEEMKEECARHAVELIDRVWEVVHGRKMDALRVYALVDAINVATANLEEEGRPEDDASARYGALRSLDWLSAMHPEVAGRITIPQLARVIRIWRQTIRGDKRQRGRAKGDAAKWNATVTLAREAGLAPASPNSLRTTWAGLRKGNRTP